MADLDAARTELKAVEAILRRRYHYPHPIFAHMTAAQEHLAEAPKAAAGSPASPPPKAAPKTPTSAKKEK